MKLFLKITGYTFLTILLIAYGLFLFVLPRKIDLNSYKELVQDLVTQNTNMKLDFKDARLITTPVLGIGAEINDVNLILPDSSELLHADNIRTKVSIPHALFLIVRVSEIKIDGLKITADTNEQATQYKFMTVIQELVNAEKEKKEEATQKSWFNPAWLKIRFANIKVNGYSVEVNDLKTKHNLVLKGDKIKALYYHRKKLCVKTYAELLSDGIQKITLDLDGSMVMPKPRQLDEEDDKNYRADIGFVNPVTLFRTYNLQANANAKIKLIKQLNGKLTLRGFANIDDLTMKFSGYQLPKSYVHSKFGRTTAELDTNIYFADNQKLKIVGFARKGRFPKLFVNASSDKIFFNDLIRLSKAVMDTLNIKNNLADIKGTGYITTNTSIKTNFKRMKSEGAIIIREGNISDAKNGNMFKDINANIIFDNNKMSIEDTHMYINNAIMTAEGEIDEKGEANISLYAEKLPLNILYAGFGPINLKKSYNLSSGNLFLDAKIKGTLKKSIADIKLKISDLVFAAKNNSIKISNKETNLDIINNVGLITGKFANKDLNLYLASSASTISNPKLEVDFDNQSITVNPMDLIVNKNSVIKSQGQVTDYNNKKILINYKATGSLDAQDLKKLAGKAAAPFIKANGKIPVRLAVSGDRHKKDITLQIASDATNYITPVDIKDLVGKQTIFQSKIDLKTKRLKIKDTGLYVKDIPTAIGDDLALNIQGATPISSIYGTIIKLDRPKPIINQLHINLNKPLEAQLCAFKDSNMNIEGKLMLFGQLVSPKFLGSYKITNLTIPTLYTNLKELNLAFLTNILKFNVDGLNLNHSDLNISGLASLAPSSKFVINNIDITSNNIDVPRVMRVSDAAMRYVPPSSPNAKKSDIPVSIKDGTINMRRISSPPIVLNNTTAKISLDDNIFKLNNLDTTILEGNVNGDIAVNLLNTMIKAKVEGRNFDTEKTLLELANVKDALTGMMSFDADLEINGAAKTQAEQMKGINGDINFEVLKGQLGPFGKLENLILAENIRESQFFQTALGGVINSLTKIETSHFDILKGHVIMNKGIAKLDPITSIGPVMCMHIAGDMNIITNEADMKLRARLGSQIANLLGPLAAINPINLVKATPGLNVGAAKLFTIFCETLSAEEMAAIPNFADDFGVMSTTNFQIVLRGSTQKPLSMIKSFKWLASFEDMEKAQEFVNTLPDADPDNPNATLEEIEAKQAELERLENENFVQKKARKFRDFFKRDKSNDDRKNQDD